MPSRGFPLTPAQIPPFELPGPRRPRPTGRGLRPSDQGLALLHVHTVTAAHGFRVLAERPRALSVEDPFWETVPAAPADRERGAEPGLRPDQQDIPRTPPHSRFWSLPKVDKILMLLTVSPALPTPAALSPPNSSSNWMGQYVLSGPLSPPSKPFHYPTYRWGD